MHIARVNVRCTIAIILMIIIARVCGKIYGGVIITFSQVRSDKPVFAVWINETIF